ncbi:YlxR family protein [Xylanimonas sp. McL0601]|uniref:YlxR family protein n=1 Tax=Xylanimonas sp. McL0601 TaxID=3414739 RepID=UPI003CF86DFC
MRQAASDAAVPSPPVPRARLSATGPRAQDPVRPRTPSPAPVAGPVRTCVGCRERDLRSALLRLVLVPDAAAGASPRVVVDERKALPGRGAWVHPSAACLDLAVRRRAVPRALRVTAPLDLAAVRDHLEPTDR